MSGQPFSFEGYFDGEVSDISPYLTPHPPAPGRIRYTAQLSGWRKLWARIRGREWKWTYEMDYESVDWQTDPPQAIFSGGEVRRLDG